MLKNKFFSLINLFSTYYKIISATIVASIIFLILVNYFFTDYLKHNPDLLMSEADKINENTRAVRESMLTPEQSLLYYDLENIEQVPEMWEEFYSVTAQFESYTHYRSKPLLGLYYGVTESGYRITADPGPWPPSKEHINLFFFGGSTSFGVGPYWATVASYLQDFLNDNNVFDKKVYVYNFGRSGYMSTQENILFQNLIREGYHPNIVVFMDGLNDFCWHDGQPSSWQMLANYFNEVNENYRKQMAGYGLSIEWDSLKKFINSLAITSVINKAFLQKEKVNIPQYQITEKIIEKAKDDAVLNQIINRYFHNIKQVNAIADSYGISSYFVWQPIPTYKYDTSNHIFMPDRLHCHINSKVGYPMVAEMKDEVSEMLNFIWAADMQENLQEPLYVDAFHYTAPMSKNIAKLIFNKIQSETN